MTRDSRCAATPTTTGYLQGNWIQSRDEYRIERTAGRLERASTFAFHLSLCRSYEPTTSLHPRDTYVDRHSHTPSNEFARFRRELSRYVREIRASEKETSLVGDIPICWSGNGWPQLFLWKVVGSVIIRRYCWSVTNVFLSRSSINVLELVQNRINRRKPSQRRTDGRACWFNAIHSLLLSKFYKIAT